MERAFEPLSSPSEVPDPEINPIQDPLLSKNLGRWAQVYFSVPPAERDAAVRLLLRELQSAAASGTASDPSEGAVCPVCQSYNPAGQRFCGFCGLLLKSHQESLAESAPSAESIDEAPHRRNSNSDLEHLRELSFSTIYGDDEPKNSGWKYFAVTVVVLAALGGGAYLQWGTQLRAKLGLSPTNVAAVTPASASPAAPSPSPSPATPQPNASGTSATQMTQNPAAGQSAAAQEPSPSVNNIDSSGNPVSTNPGSANSNPGSQEASSGQAEDSTTPEAPEAPPEENTTSVKTAAKTERVSRAVSGHHAASTPQTSSPVDNGSQELRVAEQYLNSGNGARNPAAAAQWLWKAVAKQNPTALVLLSNLYLQGDGVPRSCDQARILLVAAAKKGAPDVTAQLRNLEQNGCK